MSELKDLIMQLKMEKENELKAHQAKALRDYAENADVSTHRGDRVGAAGLGGLFKYAGARPAFP